MGAGQVVDFAPDGADFGGFAAVEADAFVEDAATHGFFLNVVVVAFYQGCFFVAFFFGKGVDVFLADCVEGVLTPVLVGAAGFGHGVSLVVAFCLDIGAEVFVVYFVAVFAFSCGTDFFGEFFLSHAHFLDGFVCGFEGFEEDGF